jgi:glycosyltransferase involved in cell wall biosynthesis
LTRVLLVGPRPATRGGISQFTAHLAGALRPHAEVTHLGFRRLYPKWTRPGRQEDVPSERIALGPVESFLVAWRPATWRRAARRIRRLLPDVVVVQWWHPAFAPCLRYLARRASASGARVVFVCHNAQPHERFPSATRLTRWALGSADVVLAPSSWTAEAVARLLPAMTVRRLPHPAYRFPPASDVARQRWLAQVGPGRPVILFFGYVRAYKGVTDLLEAMPEVRRHFPEAIVVVAGPFLDPPDPYRLRAAELGIEARFIEGYVPDEEVTALLDLGDVIVLPYRSATQSGILPLAASLGKRAVATSAGGLPELAGDGVVVVAPGEPAQLARGIVRALASPPPPKEAADAWADWRDALLEEARGRARARRGDLGSWEPAV